LGAGGPLDVGQTREASELFDVVLANGRVIDAETKLDAVRNVGIKNGHIAAVSKEQLHGRQLVDVKGLVVAPGFIDWHAHGQNTLADRVQAFDGVTTSLELEAGMLPIARWYDLQAKRKRVVNYGAASSWGVARMATLEDLPLPAEPKATALFANFGLTKWPNDVATSEQVDHIVNLTEQGLKEGGLGIGVVPGCAPGSGYKELLAVHTLAAKYNVPTYSHVRSEGDVDPLSAAQAYGERLSFAAATAANVHICHLNSTSFRDMPQAVSMIHRGLDQGLNITVEAYPYEAASTGIGAKFLAPQNLPRAGISYESVEYQGKRLDERRFKELRASNPAAIVVVHFYELPRDQRLLDMAVLFPGGIIASDAMPWVSTATGKEIDPNTWALPDDAFSHPRSAGTFRRFLGQYVRERQAISLSDALAKTTYLPAKLLEQSVPQMSRKGRLQAGMDADIVVFDPALGRDRATYERPNQTSVGMHDVLVNGTFVIRDGVLDTHAYPGQPVRRPVSPDLTTALQPRGVRGRAELEAFFDGMMTANMNDKHVAGATVSIVKDGALFFAKGYGYADADRRTPVDPDRTLFRIGSVSKLFTWTAVMQLVEEGKLDLDVDVNRYLDFKIPRRTPTQSHCAT
jgi:N-acyl-D-glutamate deacylase